MIFIKNFQLSAFNITKKCAKIYSKDARKKVSQKFRNAEGCPASPARWRYG